jgi:hypothetical protein
MSTIIRIELNVFNSKNTIRDNRNNLTPCWKNRALLYKQKKLIIYIYIYIYIYLYIRRPNLGYRD